MPKPQTLSEKKDAYCDKLRKLLNNNSRIFIAHCDNVGSNQMQGIRAALRGKGTLLMGKNTMIRRVIRESYKDTPFMRLLPLLKSNVGFVFCHSDLAEVKDIIAEHRVPAAARAGIVAPVDVIVPKGGTGLEPGMTSFFQALGISTKINKGTIEIISDVDLIKKGDKVGSSEATLLKKLNIKPFTYGLIIHYVYDKGAIYDPEVLELTQDVLSASFKAAADNVAAISLAIGYPTMAAFPHMLINGYKNVIAVSIETDYDFKGSEKIKAYLKNPSAFAAAAAPAAGAAAAGGKGAAKAPEPEEESDEEMGLDLFG